MAQDLRLNKSPKASIIISGNGRAWRRSAKQAGEWAHVANDPEGRAEEVRYQRRFIAGDKFERTRPA